MVRHTLKILQENAAKDFKSVSDHFGTLCIKSFIFLLTKKTDFNDEFTFVIDSFNTCGDYYSMTFLINP